jgi:hypothetical protein
VKSGDLLRKTSKNFLGANDWRSEKSNFEARKTDSLPDSAAFRRLPEMRMPKEVWKRACSLYLAGMDWETIASQLGVNKATLSKRASLEGVTKVKREMQTICTEKKVQSLESLSALVRSKLAADAASTLERIDNYALDGIKDEATRETILGSVAKRSALVFGWSEAGEAASVSINLLGSMPDRQSVEVNVNESDSK